MAYTSLELAKQHLNLEPDFKDDDALILQYIDAAELTVLLDINATSFEELETEPGKLPAPLQQAILLLLGTFYGSRESIVYGVIMQQVPAYKHLIHLYRNYVN